MIREKKRSHRHEPNHNNIITYLNSLITNGRLLISVTSCGILLLNNPNRLTGMMYMKHNGTYIKFWIRLSELG